MRFLHLSLLSLCLINLNLVAEDKIFDPIRTKLDDESSISDPRVQHLSYVFKETGETLPYALFVPSKYEKAKKTLSLIHISEPTRP